jgi:hypothetical protein
MDKMDKMEKEPDDLHYIYLLREREFVRLDEQCYKIGRTSQNPSKRFEGYPKGSEILMYIAVDNSIIAEKTLLTFFKKEFNQKKDYGAEYFSGDKNEMIKAIIDVATRSSSVTVALTKATVQVLELQKQLKEEKEKYEKVKKEVFKLFCEVKVDQVKVEPEIKKRKPVEVVKKEPTELDVSILATVVPQGGLLVSLEQKNVDDKKEEIRLYNEKLTKKQDNKIYATKRQQNDLRILLDKLEKKVGHKIERQIYSFPERNVDIAVVNPTLEQEIPHVEYK